MRGLEARLRRLETGRGACPLCEEARTAFLESLVADLEPGTALRYCGGCGRDVRPTVFDIDKLLEESGEGGSIVNG